MSSAKDRTPKSRGGTAMGMKCSLDDPVPSKTLGCHTNKKQHKLCQNCAKHSPKIKHTHNTSECNKWNLDGSAKGGENGPMLRT